LLDDPAITEIMVNGTKDIFIEKNGTIYRYDKHFEPKEKLEDVIQQIVSQANRVVNTSNPIVDSRLQDGSRINIVLPPIAIDGPVITIRRFPENPITMEQLIEYKSITPEAAELLEKLVIAGYNIFISGGTGSGKTTFLNVLSNFIPQNERIITIEDSAELQIRNIPNLVRLEVRNGSKDGMLEISIRDLIKTSLRMRPDRIIVGEVRDEAAIDMLQALNTGHDGSLSTGHANSPADMLSRLETLVLMGADIPLTAVRRQIASAIDIIVHLGRLRDKSRRVLEITEVLDLRNGEYVLNPIYTFVKRGQDKENITGTLEKVGELKCRDKLDRAGIRL
jgi:Type II/IV secretion system protein.